MAEAAQRLQAQDSELDRGAKSVAPGAERTCALTREIKPISTMIRFVLGPGGIVVPDVRRKLPGRGLWLTASGAALEEAIRRNIFARGFRRPVNLGPNLALETEQLLERAALDALAMAAKAGVVVAGFAKVEATLAGNGARALIHASDAAADGRRKIDAAVLRRNCEANGTERKIAVIDDFSGIQLDLALNRPNVVHAAVLVGPGSETLLARIERLQRFRTGQPADSIRAQTERAEGHCLAHKDTVRNE